MESKAVARYIHQSPFKIRKTLNRVRGLKVDDALNKYGAPKIFNTDQSSQYTSEVHTQRLLEHGIQISMDGKGRATDNIAIERFWRSIKYENIHLSEYKSIRELKKGVAEYIEFYNNRRFHQSLGYKKPMEVYMSCNLRQAA